MLFFPLGATALAGTERVVNLPFIELNSEVILTKIDEYFRGP